VTTTGSDGPVGDNERDALLAALAAFPVIVLAVSGGPDSTALLHLVHGWSRNQTRAPGSVVAVTVDHGLRPEARAEADEVARQAGALGIAHRIVRWDGPRPTSGLQAAARVARYRLLSEIARDGLAGLGAGANAAIVTAHTADDQAETFLMRLARGRGVDGLASIPPRGNLAIEGRETDRTTIKLLRPFLGIPRRRLIATLAAHSIPFSDDPSNRDRRFERVRVREALEVLETLGVTREALQRSAHRLHLARETLERAADEFEARAVQSIAGLVYEIDLASLSDASGETAVRILRRVLAEAGGAAPPAELDAVEAAVVRLLAGSNVPTFTLGGCLIEATTENGSSRAVVRVCREPDRDGGLPSIVIAPGETACWDERFHASVSETHPRPVDVGPLGADWKALLTEFPALARLELPLPAARGMPAFRESGKLLAVPALAVLLRNIGERDAASSLAGPVGWAQDGSPAPALSLRPVQPAKQDRKWSQRSKNPPW
jgi:tRNA(Ile)-lysidine synthase